MRKLTLTAVTTLILAGSFAAGVALAANSGPHGNGHRMGHRVPQPGLMMGVEGGMLGERMFQRLDTDENGEISRQEIDAAHDALRAAMDSDGDGHISRQERRAHFRQVQDERRQEAFSRLDTDSDGAIGLAEFQARAQERAARQFARLDSDGDGVLDQKELTTQRFNDRGMREHFGRGERPGGNGPER